MYRSVVTVFIDMLSERFSALHCALASEFILPSLSPHEVMIASHYLLF